MTELRWILLVLGVAVVVYVYWRGRRDQRRRDRSSEARIEPVVRPTDRLPETELGVRREPPLGDPRKAARQAADENDKEVIDTAERSISTRAPERAPPAAPAADALAETHAQTQQGPRKIIALRIARREGKRIAGAALLEALGKEGLEFGEFRIFHRYFTESPEGGPRSALFSVANMVEPGDLDPEVAGSAELPGVTVFMVLPGTRPGVSALTAMLGSARRIAAAVDGDVLDQNGSTMTRQTADHLREEVIEFEHRQKNAHRATAADR